MQNDQKLWKDKFKEKSSYEFSIVIVVPDHWKMSLCWWALILSQVHALLNASYVKFCDTIINIYNGIIFPSLNPAKIFQFISRWTESPKSSALGPNHMRSD